MTFQVVYVNLFASRTDENIGHHRRVSCMFGDVSVAGTLFIRYYRDQIAKQKIIECALPF